MARAVDSARREERGKAEGRLQAALDEERHRQQRDRCGEAAGGFWMYLAPQLEFGSVACQP
jgi:hypothetical protein